MKKTTGLSLIFLSTIAFFTYVYVHHDKFYAEWFGINVGLISLIVGPTIGWLLIFLLNEFVLVYPERFRINHKMYGIMAFSVLCFYLMGYFFTEPKNDWQIMAKKENQSSKYNDGYYYSRSGRYFYTPQRNIVYFESYDTSSSDTQSDSNSDGGEGLANLIILLVILVLIIGSAIVPHFWILASAIMLYLMAYYLNREFKLST